jgi:hypothetical protein
VSKEPKHETCPKCGKYTLDYGPQGYRCLRVDCMWEGQLPMSRESILLSDTELKKAERAFFNHESGYKYGQAIAKAAAEIHEELNLP